jgi:hypothetical protein
MRNVSLIEQGHRRHLPRLATSWPNGVIAAITVLGALGGCVTPIEVKQASKTQLDLLTTLDTATGELQQSLGQFHKSIEARIQEEGRIWIAKQAIEAANPGEPKTEVTADDLFKAHKNNVQPWIDYAFLSADIDATIGRIQDRLKKATDPSLRIQLEIEEQTWQKRKLALLNKPEAVKQIEAVIVDDLNGEIATAANVNKVLEILRAQIALMKQLAARVDSWLAIDVTVTQDQADALRQAFSAAAAGLGGAK